MTYTAQTETVKHLAALVIQARPEWDLWLVEVVLLNHADQVDGTDLAIAALRCAKNPGYPTPKAIGWRGPHWDNLETMPAEVKRPDRCYTCGKPEPLCYGVRLADDTHLFETIAQAEANAAKARQAGPRRVPAEIDPGDPNHPEGVDCDGYPLSGRERCGRVDHRPYALTRRGSPRSPDLLPQRGTIVRE